MKTQFVKEHFWVQLHNLPFRCMNRYHGKIIDETIGMVIEVNVDTDDIGWVHFQRVRVVINMSKPLACNRSIKVNDKTLWIPLK